METLKKSVTIPEDHHLGLDLELPADIPTGPADVVLVFEHAQHPTPHQRVLGAQKGKMSTTDDFDAPLPDEFWLGEGQ